MRCALGYTRVVRAGHKPHFLDVGFRDTVERPLDVVRIVYGFLG